MGKLRKLNSDGNVWMRETNGTDVYCRCGLSFRNLFKLKIDGQAVTHLPLMDSFDGQSWFLLNGGILAMNKNQNVIKMFHTTSHEGISELRFNKEFNAMGSNWKEVWHVRFEEWDMADFI